MIGFDYYSYYCRGAFSYINGEERTRNIVPSGSKIGSGSLSEVFEHRYCKSLVIKKSTWVEAKLENEYEVGRKLKHPNLVEIVGLVKKIYRDEQENILSVKYKLILKKIEGATLHAINLNPLKSENLFTNKKVSKLFEQAKDLCLYLYDSGILWADLNPSNIYISSTENLVVGDLGAWGASTHPGAKATHLTSSANSLLTLIVNSCSVIAPSLNDSEQESKVKKDLRAVIKEGFLKNAEMYGMKINRIKIKTNRTEENVKIRECLSDFFDDSYLLFAKSVSTRRSRDGI